MISLLSFFCNKNLFILLIKISFSKNSWRILILLFSSFLRKNFTPKSCKISATDFSISLASCLKSILDANFNFLILSMPFCKIFAVTLGLPSASPPWLHSDISQIFLGKNILFLYGEFSISNCNFLSNFSLAILIFFTANSVSIISSKHDFF